MLVTTNLSIELHIPIRLFVFSIQQPLKFFINNSTSVWFCYSVPDIHCVKVEVCLICFQYCNGGDLADYLQGLCPYVHVCLYAVHSELLTGRLIAVSVVYYISAVIFICLSQQNGYLDYFTHSHSHTRTHTWFSLLVLFVWGTCRAVPSNSSNASTRLQIGVE